MRREPRPLRSPVLLQAVDELGGEALGGLRRDCQRGFLRNSFIVVFQTAKLWRGIQTFPADQVERGRSPDYLDFTTSSVFRGTGQPTKRSALLTANWRGWEAMMRGTAGPVNAPRCM